MNIDLKKPVILSSLAIFSSVLVWLPVGMKKVYENFDGAYYGVVAKSLYNQEIIRTSFSFPLPLEYYPAHFPLFPILMRIVSLIGTHTLASGLFINVLFAAVGACVMCYIWEKMKWGDGLWAGGVWLFLWPRMWAVRSVVSPETLFVTLIMLSLYFFGKKRYFYAGLAGAAATLTKSPGILIFVAFLLVSIEEYLKSKKLEMAKWPIFLIPLALLGLFFFYYFATGDFLAYFHSGDNLHLQLMPFRVFDSSQAWVGDWWLEDIVWMYVVSALGVLYAFKKSRVWGWFGVVFLGVIIFVSHRDIARYSLPLVPVVILGLFDLLKIKAVRYVLIASLIPAYFYTLNFMSHNFTAITDWMPFYLFSK